MMGLRGKVSWINREYMKGIGRKERGIGESNGRGNKGRDSGGVNKKLVR